MSTVLISAAVSAVISFFAGIFTERLRQKHSKKDAHFQEIKTIVLGYIQDQLVDHYLRILESKEGALVIGSEQITKLEETSSSYQVVLWKPVLRVKPPQISCVSSVGGTFELQRHEETYPHLYRDAKERHFSKLFIRWEQLDSRFHVFCVGCLELCQHLAKKLEESIRVPLRVESSQQENWVNYPRLSVFIYERLFGVSNGGLNLYEQPIKWRLDWYGDQCGQGTKDEMERCKEIVDSLLKSEKASAKPFIEEARRLKPDLIAIKDELERLVLQRSLPGRCEYV